MAKRTLMCKGIVTKMYLDEKFGTNKSVAVISYADPSSREVQGNSHLLQRKFLVPGAGFEIGQAVTISVETE